MPSTDLRNKGTAERAALCQDSALDLLCRLTAMETSVRNAGHVVAAERLTTRCKQEKNAPDLALRGQGALSGYEGHDGKENKRRDTPHRESEEN